MKEVKDAIKSTKTNLKGMERDKQIAAVSEILKSLMDERSTISMGIDDD